MSKNAIIAGLVVFVATALFPFWFNIGGSNAAPEIELSERAKAARYCVLEKYDMRAEHMSLLDEWRDSVVRDADRLYKGTNGKSFNMSLSTGEDSCLGCHTDKEKFCDRCHNFVSVAPYCWECHTTPEEVTR
ncbi:MAG: sulfate reduction electron transfer complex DsrMKJOP subunit DsrJ [Desulfamplus sp.]|nr:sulfate reduction electron transfer complex DsrMKJOP subunit DsrJ [Desulfamplus sp.]